MNDQNDSESGHRKKSRKTKIIDLLTFLSSYFRTKNPPILSFSIAVLIELCAPSAPMTNADSSVHSTLDTTSSCTYFFCIIFKLHNSLSLFVFFHSTFVQSV